ncbi:MAG: hypothetical protein WDM70_03040 [Nitrosomonadales bacterium]
MKSEFGIISPRDFRQKLLAMLGLCFVLVMVALDQTVIGTALPTVVAELNGFRPVCLGGNFIPADVCHHGAHFRQTG